MYGTFFFFFGGQHNFCLNLAQIMPPFVEEWWGGEGQSARRLMGTMGMNHHQKYTRYGPTVSNNVLPKYCPFSCIVIVSSMHLYCSILLQSIKLVTHFIVNAQSSIFLMNSLS